MNEIQLIELSKLVENLTIRSKSGPDEVKLKELKKKCKASEECVKHTYHLVTHQLQKPHSEIRVNALIVMNELFVRSHVFRDLVVSSFQTFLEMTVETDPDQPLPPPKHAAKDLKVKALQYVKNWYNKFGEAYKKLQLGYNFLKTCKRVDFNDIEARTVGERERVEIQRRYCDELNEKKAERADAELKSVSGEIAEYLLQLENCFRLLMPHPDDFFVKSDFTEMDHAVLSQPDSNVCIEKINEEDKEKHNTLREHGLSDPKLSLELNISQNISFSVNDDNKDIVETTKELYQLVNKKFKPTIDKIIRIFSKTGKKTDSLKYAIDIKGKLNDSIDKFHELDIDLSKIHTDKLATESDEDDFEEVPEKEGYEAVIPENLRAEYGLNALPVLSKKPRIQNNQRKWTLVERGKDDIKDPTTISAQPSCSQLTDLPSTSSSFEEEIAKPDLPAMPVNKALDPKKAKLLKIAPKLRYDMDLYIWEEEKLIAPSVMRYDDLHEFWSHNDNATFKKNFMKDEDADALRCRVMDFSGDFEKVKWSCRAPLPSGKLCPRQDRKKCPFHGVIIPRDELGKPTDEADIKRIAESEERKAISNPDWQDPKLLEDIKAEIGVDLKVEKKGKGGKGKKSKRKYSELTDIKKIHDTSRNRLEKKVLNKASIKRIESSANAEKQKLFDDKFGDSWNYSMLNLR